MNSHAAYHARFNDHERRLLLAQPRIGPMVVDRLEQAGFHSFAALRQRGVEQAVLAVCSALGSAAWTNRRKALEQVLAQHLERSPQFLHRASRDRDA